MEIIFHEEEELQDIEDIEDSSPKGEFKYPKNVKQIGNISSRLKIYIEDYAYQYLNQYKSVDINNEKIGFLIGKKVEFEENEVLLISGVVRSSYSKSMSSSKQYFLENLKFAKSQSKKYFDEMDIVGWVHIQPSYGVFLGAKDINVHKEQFPEINQVLLISDPLEKLDSFYAWDDSQRDMEELTGFFIYYGKNDAMSNYMLDNKIIEITALSEKKIAESKKDVAASYRKKERIKKSVRSTSNRMVPLLASLSGIMFLGALVMGIALVQNGDRISFLESKVEALNDSYKNMVAQINGGSVYPAFAGQKNIAENTQISDGLAVTPPDELLPEKTDNTPINTQGQIGESSTPAQIFTPEEINIPVALVTTPPTEETIVPPVSIQETTQQSDTQTPPVLTTQMISNGTQTINNPPDVAISTSSIPDTYVVEEGDSLSFISVKFYGDKSMMKKIMEINGITDANKVVAGKVIKLPKED